MAKVNNITNSTNMGYYNNSRGYSLFSLLFLAALCLALSIVIIQCRYSDPHWETITVTEKNINPGNGNEEKWLVYTEGEVYCITDLWWAGFFNSSDVYNSLKVGNTYRVYVSGKRWPIWSAYKVIRKAEPLECDI